MMIISGKNFKRLQASMESIAMNQQFIAQSGERIAKDNFFTKLMSFAVIAVLGVVFVRTLRNM